MRFFEFEGELYVLVKEFRSHGKKPLSVDAIMSKDRIGRIKGNRVDSSIDPWASLVLLSDAIKFVDKHPHCFNDTVHRALEVDDSTPPRKRKRDRAPTPTDMHLEPMPHSIAGYPKMCKDWDVVLDDGTVVVPAGTCRKKLKDRTNHLLVYTMDGEEYDTFVCECQLGSLGLLTPTAIEYHNIDGVKCVKRLDLEPFSAKKMDALVGKLNRSSVAKFKPVKNGCVYLNLRDLIEFAKANREYFRSEFFAVVDKPAPTNVASEPLDAAKMGDRSLLCKDWAVPGIAPAGTCGKPFDQRRNFTVTYTLGDRDCVTVACECQMKDWGLAVPEKKKQLWCTMEVDMSYISGFPHPKMITQAPVAPRNDGSFLTPRGGGFVVIPACAVFAPRPATKWEELETDPILSLVEVGHPVIGTFTYYWDLGVIIGNNKEKREFTIAFKDTNEKGGAKQKRVSYDLVRKVTPNRKIKK